MLDLIRRAENLMLESVILLELSKQLRYGSFVMEFTVQDGVIVLVESQPKFRRNLAKEREKNKPTVN